MNLINLKQNIEYLKLKYEFIDYETYKQLMNLIVIIASIFFSTICYISSSNIEYTIYLFVFLIIIGYAIFYYYPIMLKKQFIGKIEKDLPFFLIDLDMKLSIGQEFISSLKELSKEYDFLGTIFTKIIDNYEKGISLQKSSREYSKLFDSQDFKRALTQIMNIYDSGKCFKERGPLFELSEEIVNIQTTHTKLYSNKLVMVSLLFIGITAILPSLLLVFVNIGSFILDLGITGNQLLLIFILVFPAIDIIIIFVILNMMPAFLR